MKQNSTNFKTLAMIGACLMMLGCSNTGNAKERPAYNAGMFYPKSPVEIRHSIQNYFDAVELKTVLNKPFGIISPHAGYPYSGPVAAYGFTALKNHHYDAVVVISPCHVDYFNFASIYDGDAYLTPLGKLVVDKSITKKLQTDDKRVQISSKGHVIGMNGRAEHSLEVQLPFIQIALGDVPVVPVVLGTMDWDVIQTLGQQLGKIAQTHDILIVASSDLSHFHSYGKCNKIDRQFMDILESFSVENLYKGLMTKSVEACGGGPIIALMLAAQMNNINHLEILNYANSGDVPFGDKSRVVGYMSAAVYKEINSKSKDVLMNDTQAKNRYLNTDEQEFLIQLAEDVIDACVKGNPIPEPKDIPAICREERGAFVTIEKHGQLRGCIGYILPVYPLYETVIEVAQSAALKDPRFNRVSPGELKDLEIEVSVLTIPEKIDDPSIIEVGKHGIIMKRGFYQGLLLPQVATDYGWDRVTFLEHTCQKAGLPRNAWKDKDTEISIFSAQVFNRKTLGK
ncbi:MAG: AmmeMemoRadiSam system protein B [Candidatus Marinimicrobia bacterium]|nr:AmmeMemoRadiSam system protein B [Candidatus Neomarinimicrobiota bacterium]